jgi:hypothetical protein
MLFLAFLDLDSLEVTYRDVLPSSVFSGIEGIEPIEEVWN